MSPLTFGLLIILFSSFSHAGGVSIVGNGGFIVTCGQKTEVFDIFERRVQGERIQYSLGGSRLTIQQKIQVGVARIRERFRLNPQDSLKVERAALFAASARFDPWTEGYAHGWGYLLNSVELNTLPRIAGELNRLGCQIDIAYFRPIDTPDNRIHFSDLCGWSEAREFDFCFFINSVAYRFLNADQKACLALHEAFRFLPAAQIIRDEYLMRKQVAQVCTE